MKKILCLLLCLYSSFSLADICATENNIKDYFLTIPSDLFQVMDDEKGPLDTPQKLADAIDVLDARNGFIALQTNTILNDTKVVLYRAAKRAPVILITEDGVSVQRYYALSCYNQQWHDVTATIFPEISKTNILKLYNDNKVLINNDPATATIFEAAHSLIRYQLPKQGKEIAVLASHPDIVTSPLPILFKFEPDLPSLTFD